MERHTGGFGQRLDGNQWWVPFPKRQHEESTGVRNYGDSYPKWDDFNDSATFDVSFWCDVNDDEDSILDLVDNLSSQFTPLYQQVSYDRNKARGTVCLEGRPVAIVDRYVPEDGNKNHGKKSLCVRVKVQKYDGSDLTKEDFSFARDTVARGLWAHRDYEVR